jgi:hypothetical protein
VVIEHGIPDPGYRYTGELAAAGAVVNEPVRALGDLGLPRRRLPSIMARA